MPGAIVLVCAAHPDDEILGCGGTMAAHAAQGDEVHVLLLGRGIESRGTDEAARAELEQAARRANERAGTRTLRLADFPDNRMDGVMRLDIVREVEAEIDRYRPDIVYTHHASDMNVDHQRVHDAVSVACRPVPGSSVHTLLFFEIPSSTEWRPAGTLVPFVPARFVDIGATLATKRAALLAYASEMRPFPHPRSIEAVEALARWRGATAGLDAAEAFVIGRQIVRAPSSV